MDDLRWILLAAGIVIVVAVYLWSRAKKQDKFSSASAVVEEIPSFTATDTDDGWVDGVSPVRVVAKAEDIQIVDDIETLSADDKNNDSVDDESIEEAAGLEQAELDIPEPEAVEDVVETAEEPVTETEPPAQENKRESEIPTDDVIALYLIVKDQQPLKGESILSAALANHLQYGDMKIFHRKDKNQKTIFSMANMHEPGHFDSANIHKLRTRGVSFFIQLSLCDDPVKALDDMLICAHSMAGMLGTHLCDQNRHLLNEAYTRALREKAKHFSV